MFTLWQSIAGRTVRFLVGCAVALWGFDLGLPHALFVQTVGVSVAIFAIAGVDEIAFVAARLHRRAAAARERHA